MRSNSGAARGERALSASSSSSPKPTYLLSSSNRLSAITVRTSLLVFRWQLGASQPNLERRAGRGTTACPPAVSPLLIGRRRATPLERAPPSAQLLRRARPPPRARAGYARCTAPRHEQGVTENHRALSAEPADRSTSMEVTGWRIHGESVRRGRR